MATTTAANAKLEEVYNTLSYNAALKGKALSGSLQAFVTVFENKVCNRRINFHHRANKDGDDTRNVLEYLCRTNEDLTPLINTWLETKDNIKWGGPLCGFFDPDKTVFVIEVHPKILALIRERLLGLDDILRRSEVKTWGCLSWNPITWWFTNVFFPFHVSSTRLRATKTAWCHEDFQLHAKHIEIDMSRSELVSPILFLDALLSYLGPLPHLDKLDIKVKVSSRESWPPGGDIPDREAQIPNIPTVPLWAVIWKWRGMCEPTIPPEYINALGVSPAPIPICCPRSCYRNRPMIRYWNVADAHQSNWTELDFIPVGHDAYFQQKLIRQTCTERQYWTGQINEVKNGSRCYGARQDSSSSMSTDTGGRRLYTYMNAFLEDIGAKKKPAPDEQHRTRQKRSRTKQTRENSSARVEVQESDHREGGYQEDGYQEGGYQEGGYQEGGYDDFETTSIKVLGSQ